MDKDKHMPHAPFISVIIPTYDRPESLAYALDSLANQTYRNFEVIIANDGEHSIDSILEASGLEREVVQEVLTGGNRGVAAARNMGLEAAKGEIAAYLDDDDIFLPDHLSVHAEAYAESPSTHVVYTDAERVVFTPKGSQNEMLYRNVQHSQDFDADELLVANYIPTLCISHRIDCIGTVGKFDTGLRSLEGWEFFIRLSRHWHFVHIPYVTGRYYERQLGFGIHHEYAGNFVSNLDEVYNRTAHTLENDPARYHKVQAMRLDHLAGMSMDAARRLENQGDRDNALLLYHKSAEYSPSPEAYVALARLHMQMGQIPKSRVCLKLAKECERLGDQCRGV